MSSSSKGTVFYVEDDKFLSDLLSAKLISSGFTLEFSENGEKALAALSTSKADVFLIDLLLPGVSGFDVISAIRANENHKDKPVVIFSNYGDQESIDEGFKRGANKYLVKSSFVPDELISEVESILEGDKS